MGDADNDEKYTTTDLATALELYNNAPCGSISFFKDGTIYAINNTMLTWLGYDRDEIINKRTLTSLFKIGGQIFFETHFFPLIKMQGSVNEVYFDIVKKDKSILHALINARETPSKKEDSEIYQATILDISDRWTYEMELLNAKKKAEKDSKAKAELLATISHEIRTPLNSILGIGNLLNETPLNKNQKEYARLLLHSSEHLLSLVNNLLDLSKIEAQKFKLEQIPFNLGDMVKVLRETFRVKAKEKGIKLKLSIAKDVPNNLIGDPVKINQILTNLIGNALKFTKVGAVTLGIRLLEKSGKTNHLLRFDVSDTGIGIPPEKLEAIFQEFSQASYEVSVEYGGTGLGLTISQKLLELHNSKMELESTYGKGSCFSFSIWYTADTKPQQKLERQTNFEDLQGLKDFAVLVVDDNPNNVFIATQYLDHWDITYKTASSGKKALSLIKKHVFNLVLLDLQMPEMDGYETALNIRELKAVSQPFIVAFSASAIGDVAHKLKEAKINDHLPKPFQPKELADILLKYYKISKGRKESKKDIKATKPKKITKHVVKVAKQVIDTPSFTITRYKKMANNKPEFIKKFVLSTLDAFATYQEDFKKIVTAKDVKDLSDFIHRSTMSFYYIEADPLGALLNELRDHLNGVTEDNRKFDDIVNDCLSEFSIINKGLQKIAERK